MIIIMKCNKNNMATTTTTMAKTNTKAYRERVLAIVLLLTDSRTQAAIYCFWWATNTLHADNHQFNWWSKYKQANKHTNRNCFKFPWTSSTTEDCKQIGIRFSLLSLLLLLLLLLQMIEINQLQRRQQHKKSLMMMMNLVLITIITIMVLLLLLWLLLLALLSCVCLFVCLPVVVSLLLVLLTMSLFDYYFEIASKICKPTRFSLLNRLRFGNAHNSRQNCNMKAWTSKKKLLLVMTKMTMIIKCIQFNSNFNCIH